METGERYFPDYFKYKTVPIDDFEIVDIKKHFRECIQFITDAHNEGGTVLVHCQAGMSRSVTIAAAFLMEKHKVSAVDALKIIRSKRPYAHPNSGFCLQLQ